MGGLTIVIDGGDGPVMFGPIIVEVPDEKEATDLWRAEREATRVT
jgi:hypothetical protein